MGVQKEGASQVLSAEGHCQTRDRNQFFSFLAKNAKLLVKFWPEKGNFSASLRPSQTISKKTKDGKYLHAPKLSASADERRIEKTVSCFK